MLMQFFSPHGSPKTLVSTHQRLFGILARGLCRMARNRAGRKLWIFNYTCCCGQLVTAALILLLTAASCCSCRLIT